MPDIQGYPRGFSPSISVDEVFVEIETLNGAEVADEKLCKFSVGLHRPQMDYFICLSTVEEEGNGCEISKEIFIPITPIKFISFLNPSTIGIDLENNDTKWTQLKIKSEIRLKLCKIFACFEAPNFKGIESGWTQEHETLTSELRSSILQRSKTSVPHEENHSFTRVKVVIPENGNDFFQIFTKIQSYKPQKICLDFGDFEPNFGFVESLDLLVDLEEIEIYGKGFKSAAVAGFLKAVKKFKNIKGLIFASNNGNMKEKDFKTQSIIRFCPSHITTLGLLFYEQIPHTIEYLKNLEHLFVSIHNLFSYRLFTLPNLKTINVSRINSYKQNFFPATALKYDIDRNLINTGFYALDTVYHIEQTWTPKIPSLFEIAAGTWYTNDNLQKTQIPDIIQKRLFHGRVDFQMCTACGVVFNDKLFSAWIIRQKELSQRQYFKHKFCFECYEKDRIDHQNCDIVITRNHC